ncbi:MAG TPA: carboxypeptidase-like regulatory domain-containing protein [Candidatus Acidoferrales bacterium]|nr:carboxypeptidase-like regulatory domain-containing protein [Candidatus Acidoferrales bacterium]
MGSSRLSNAFLLVVFAFLSATPRLSGQAVSARLEGLVQDQSKAVVPGVTVVAMNQGIGLRVTSVSNQSGRYIFPNLPPGTYTVSADHPGFKRVVLQGILLQIGDHKTVDVTLSVGEATQSVTVSAQASPVNTTTVGVGAVVQNLQAVDLPLNGRDPMMLFYLQAGTNPLDRVGGNQQQNGVVNGLDPNASEVKVEGILSSNPGYDYSPAHPSSPVPDEAVGEYRVSTSTDQSNAGNGSGAQVNVMIKSGTNRFHGAVYEFNRNTDYDANDFFSNKNGLSRAILKRNQFGFALGGPIRRNHTFFFGTAEWQRQVSDSIENRFVYTPLLRTGIYRYLIGGTNSTSIVNSQGVPTVPAGNIGTINLAAVDPTRQGLDTAYLPKLLALMPQPNNYDIGDGLNLAGYAYDSSNPDNYYQWLAKIDHQLTSKHQLSLTLSQDNETAPQPRLVDGISPEGFQEKRRAIALRLVSVLGSHMTNELSVGANERTAIRPITNTVNFPGIDGAGQQTPAGNIQYVGLGNGSLGSPDGNLHVLRSPQVNPAVNKGFSDQATWVVGNHTVSFGGELWRETLNRDIANNPPFPVLSTSNASNPANIPALAGLSGPDRARAAQLTNDLTGTIGSIAQSFYLNNKQGFTAFQEAHEPLRKVETSLFVQDIWKARRNLSLNGGVRWEYLPPVTLADGVYVYPIGGVAGALGIQGPTGQPTQWGFAPNDGGSIFNAQKNNFGPAVGVSWDPFGDGKTAVSAAYRIAFDRFQMVAGDFSKDNYGGETSITLTPFTRFSNPALNNGILPIPTPALFAPLGNIRQGTGYVADSHLKTPYVSLWNFSIERQVGSNWKVSASYVGNHEVGLWRGLNLNQVQMLGNGFLSAFEIAQQNLAQNGSPTKGQSLGSLQPLFALVPSSQYILINQGQAAALADFLDTTTLKTGARGGLIALAGLPATFFRYNPQVQNLYIVGNRSHSTWDGLQLELSRSFQRGLYFQANYTLSKGSTDSVPDPQSFTSDYRDASHPGLDKSLSPLDSTHVILVNGIWALPIGRGRRLLSNASGWLDGAIGGWQFNGIYNFSTGRPLLITTGRFNVNQTVASNPNFSGGFANLSGVHKGASQVTFVTPQQTAAFSNPGAGSAGTLANYPFHGPGFSALDMSLFKEFRLKFLGEAGQLQFRAEAFNILNHTSFQDPSGRSPALNINSGSFGVLTSAYPARIGQFGLKLSF